jgi:hypothetical protein
MIKFIFILSSLILLINCSLQKNSKYWNEVDKNRIKSQQKLSTIFKKTNDIKNMTIDEYKIYIDDHTKKSKYPKISQ